MTPEQEIRTAALNASVAWAAGLSAMYEPIIDNARRFEEYILGTDRVQDRDANGRLVIDEPAIPLAGQCPECGHWTDRHSVHGCGVFERLHGACRCSLPDGVCQIANCRDHNHGPQMGTCLECGHDEPLHIAFSCRGDSGTCGCTVPRGAEEGFLRRG